MGFKSSTIRLNADFSVFFVVEIFRVKTTHNDYQTGSYHNREHRMKILWCPPVVLSEARRFLNILRMVSHHSMYKLGFTRLPLSHDPML